MQRVLLKYQRPLFYFIWLLLHFVQALNTELFDDEAYYWVYSKFPEWGYFDHPPMIAMLIKAGYGISKNELGVRLFSLLSTTAALFVAESLISKKNTLLFYAICGSLAVAQIGGFIAAPDSPLLLFVALFFHAYRKFIDRMSIANTLWIGVVIALMFYTKYHALLVLVFTGLSNLKLFKHWQPYAACLFALVLFIPHLYWQYENGYPSLLYHLFERNAPEYEPWNSVEFIIVQILQAGPFAGWLLICAALSYKSKSPLEKALRFTLIGFYLFFLLSTFRGKAEANWTLPAFIGLIVLGHQYLVEKVKLRKLLFRLLPVTLILVFAARVIMIADMQPAWWIFKDEFHGNKIFAQQVRSLAKDLPVVFPDTYQKPSKYWFYSGDTAFALNTPAYRRNNFNYWPIEDSFIGRPAYVFGLEKDEQFIRNYFSFSKVMINNIEPEQVERTLSIKFTVQSPGNYLRYFRNAPYDTASFYMAIYKSDTVAEYVNTGIKVNVLKNVVERQIATFPLTVEPGEYLCKLAISSCLPGKPSLNSSRFKISID